MIPNPSLPLQTVTVYADPLPAGLAGSLQFKLVAVDDSVAIAPSNTGQNGVTITQVGATRYRITFPAPAAPNDYVPLVINGTSTYEDFEVLRVAAVPTPPAADATRDLVRREIQDGQPSTEPAPYSIVRLEDLSDEIPAQATPTQRQFLVRFGQVPTEQWVTVQVVPGSLVAYVDGSALPVAPTSDVDQNGNFTLPAAPVSQLQVTYGWQYFSDTDLDGFIDQARSWLLAVDVASVPDGLMSPLVKFAAARALDALARKCTLANVRAGDAQINLSDLAKAYRQQSAALDKAAAAERQAFSQKPERLAPAVSVGTLSIPQYTPRR